jgi:hypothetical protein
MLRWQNSQGPNFLLTGKTGSGKLKHFNGIDVQTDKEDNG